MAQILKKLPRTSTLGIDYDNIKQDIREIIQEDPLYNKTWDDFLESSVGSVFLELTAWVADQLASRVDWFTNENFISTAKEKESVIRLLNLIGYKLKQSFASEVIVDVTFASDISNKQTYSETISRGYVASSRRLEFKTISAINRDGDSTTFEAISYTPETQTYNYNDSVSITINNSSVRESDKRSKVYFLQGTTNSEIITVDRREGFRINLNKTPIIENSIKIYRLNNNNSILYEIPEVSSFIDRRAQESAFPPNLLIKDIPFIRNVEKDDTITIEFGNSFLLGSGRLPDPGEKYLIVYRTGGGISGNVNRRALNFVENKTDPTDGNQVSITYQNLEEGQRGLDQEDYLRAAQYGPISLRSVEKAVTTEDYSVLLSRFENVLLSSSYGEQNLPINFFERYGEYASPMDVWNFVAMNNSRWETIRRSDYKNFRWAKLNLENNFNNVIRFSSGETNAEINLRLNVFNRDITRQLMPIGSEFILRNAVEIQNTQQLLNLKKSLISAKRFYWDINTNERVFLEDYELPPAGVLPEDVEVLFFPNMKFLATFNKFGNVYRIKKFLNDYFDKSSVPYLDFKEYYSIDLEEEDFKTLDSSVLYSFLSERAFKVEEQIKAFIFARNKKIGTDTFITIPSNSINLASDSRMPAIIVSIDGLLPVKINLLNSDPEKTAITNSAGTVLNKTEIFGERRISQEALAFHINEVIGSEYSTQIFNTFILQKNNIFDVASYISELSDENSDIILKIPFKVTREIDSVEELKQIQITVGRTFNWKFLLEKINEELQNIDFSLTGTPLNMMARFSAGDFGSTEHIQFITLTEGYLIEFDQTEDDLLASAESFYKKLQFTNNITLTENYEYDAVARVVPASETSDSTDRLIIESPITGLSSQVRIYPTTDLNDFNAAFDIFSLNEGISYGTRGIVVDLNINSINLDFESNPIVGQEIVADWSNVGDLIYYNGSSTRDYRRENILFLNFISDSEGVYRLGEYFSRFGEENPLFREKNNFVYNSFIKSTASGPEIDFENSNIVLRFTENEVSENSVFVIKNRFRNMNLEQGEDFVEINIRESDYPSFTIDFSSIFSQELGGSVPAANTELTFFAYDDYEFSITVASADNLFDTNGLTAFAAVINSEIESYFSTNYPGEQIVSFDFATVEERSLVFKSSDKKNKGRIFLSGISPLLIFQTNDLNSVIVTPPDNYEDPELFENANFDVRNSITWQQNFGPGKITPYPPRLEYYIIGDYALDFIEEEIENSSFKEYTTILLKTNNPNNRFPDRSFFVHYVSDFRFLGETEGSTSISLRTVDLTQFGIEPRKDSDEDLLNNYFFDKKIIGIQNRWKSPLFSTFDIIGDVFVSRAFPPEEVKRQVENALYSRYSILNASLNMIVSKQEVSDVIRSVAGVIFSNIIYLGRDSRNEFIFNIDGSVRSESEIDTRFIISTSISSSFDEAFVLNDTNIERNRVVSGISLRYIVQ